MKLLERQKEGKARMKLLGKVQVPHEAFISLMRLSGEGEGGGQSDRRKGTR